MQINIYYTNIENKYGLLIEEVRENSSYLAYAKSGININNEMALLSALDGVADYLKTINNQGLINKKSDVIVKFYSPNYESFKHVTKVNTDYSKIKSMPNNQIGLMKTISSKMNPILKKTLYRHNAIKHDIESFEKDKLSLIKKYLSENNFKSILGEYQDNVVSGKIEVLEKNNSILININKKMITEERTLRKRERRLAKEQEKRDRMQSPEYQEMITLMLDKELSLERFHNTTQLSIQNKYNLNKVKNLLVYTDGSTREEEVKNHNNHGYGVIIVDNDTGETLFKFKGRMSENMKEMAHIEMIELYAIYRAALFINNKIKENILEPNINILVRTDNQDNIIKYESFINKEEGVLLRGKRLFEELLKETQNVSLEIEWVKGHSSDIHNKEVDKMAKSSLSLENDDEYIIHHAIEEKNELMELTKDISKPHKKLKIA